MELAQGIFNTWRILRERIHVHKVTQNGPASYQWETRRWGTRGQSCISIASFGAYMEWFGRGKGFSSHHSPSKIDYVATERFNPGETFSTRLGSSSEGLGRDSGITGHIAERKHKGNWLLDSKLTKDAETMEACSHYERIGSRISRAAVQMSGNSSV